MRGRPRDSGTSLLWAGVDSIWFITAPCVTHAANNGSSPQPTPGKFEPFAATTTATTRSAEPATHAPAHAAAGRQLRGCQPRSRTNPATSNGTASSSHTTAASTPTSAITPGSPFHSRNQNSSPAHSLVVHPTVAPTKP